MLPCLACTAGRNREIGFGVMRAAASLNVQEAMYTQDQLPSDPLLFTKCVSVSIFFHMTQRIS